MKQIQSYFCNMLCIKTLLFSVFLLLFLGTNPKITAQTPNDQQLCPFVNAGPDVNICNGEAVTLTATFADIRQPTTYEVGDTPYNPFSYTTGTNILVDDDDIWSSIINMGFNFCYWGNSYNLLVLGSNGMASFNLPYAGQYCTWPINSAWPSAVGTVLNAIGSPWHDLDPSVNYDPSRIKIHTTGTAPCRKFIIIFNQVPMATLTCNSQLAKHQIVFHETSNVIDIHIENKPLCSVQNNGRAIQGIQNANGTLAVVVPGRNSPTQWTASFDSKRFYPTGAPAYTIQWLQGTTHIGNTASINVNPTTTTTYTMRVTYTNCNGTQTIVSDDVTVNVCCLNIGNPCDDGNPNTINDLVQCDCSCVGTPITCQQFLQTDSLQLVTFYNATGSINWINNTNYDLILHHALKENFFKTNS